MERENHESNIHWQQHYEQQQMVQAQMELERQMNGCFLGDRLPHAEAPSKHLIEIQNGSGAIVGVGGHQQMFAVRQHQNQMDQLTHQMEGMDFQGHFGNGAPQSRLEDEGDSYLQQDPICQSPSARSKDPVYASMASHLALGFNNQSPASSGSASPGSDSGVNSASSSPSMEMGAVSAGYPRHQHSMVLKRPDVLPRCNLQWI